MPYLLLKNKGDGLDKVIKRIQTNVTTKRVKLVVIDLGEWNQNCTDVSPDNAAFR
jgi:hypothetical protein